MHRRVAFILCLLLLWVPAGAISDDGDRAEQPPLRILVLFSYEEDLPAYDGIYRGLRRVFASGWKGEVQFYPEYLDLLRFKDEAYRENLVQLFRHKYRRAKPDLVIVEAAGALDFVLQHGEDLFPGAPVVICSVGRPQLEKRHLKPNMAAISRKIDIEKLLDLVFYIHPETRYVAMVVGESRKGTVWLEKTRKLFAGYESRAELMVLKGLSLDELIERAARFPPRTVAISFPIRSDRLGRFYDPIRVIDGLAASSSAPLYTFAEIAIGHGVVGGYMANHVQLGSTIGELALGILKEGKVQPSGIVGEASKSYVFDWRQLRRWGISESALPPGSILRYRETSLWSAYKWHILGLVLLCTLEAGLILSLVIARGHGKRMERRMRETTRQMLMAQEQERQRISMELHDELGQALMTLKLRIGTVRKSLPDVLSKQKGDMESALDYIDHISKNVHRISRDLSPALLQDLGLAAAIRWLIEDLSETLHVEVSGGLEELKEACDDRQAIIVFRIVQEALTNVRKHSHASRLSVRVRRNTQEIAVFVTDNGKGFKRADGYSAHSTKRGGLGLAAMEERAVMLGARLRIWSEVGQGTEIGLMIPTG